MIELTQKIDYELLSALLCVCVMIESPALSHRLVTQHTNQVPLHSKMIYND